MVTFLHYLVFETVVASIIQMWKKDIVRGLDLFAFTLIGSKLGTTNQFLYYNYGHCRPWWWRKR